ncbi:NAD-dependent aldehyde dehydrogenase [Gluconacetobacter sacchari DSM 12717]|uniref:HTH-type transcriptional regulator BetI n=2 Tax=Gluconacetobacter sacchari TaxID=92759 RepID=A0A7W4NIW5_9PROT|nr:betaine-aldehyde dehydrogenase [Gluconacetobacter sacchari]MBB2158579.1 betaine-aldehyde dehydrogenase [Gluconacetobacter sacchari]GBQ26594.1 NAD-dependent aldehyde dehydrogenase [Gluconacetobacter sacchari DSM 12717]
MKQPIPSLTPIELKRRGELVAATRDVLVSHGYAGATVARIARHAGVSPALLVHYFGDKDTLLALAFRGTAAALSADVARAVRAARGPRARLEALVGACLGGDQFTTRQVAIWLALWGQAVHVPTLGRIQHAYQSRMLSNLRYDLGHLLPPQQARAVADTLASLIDGTWLRAALAPPATFDSRLPRQQVLAFLHGQIGTETASSPPPAILRGAPDAPCTSWIDGRPVTGGGPRFETRNPATNAVLAEVEEAGELLVAQAIEAAARGQVEWAARTGAERARILRRAADLLRRDNAALARLETLDTGKPIAETSSVDVASGADALEYFAALAATMTGDCVDLGPTAFGYTRREPLGIVAGIGAWNYPIQIACWKAAPALACGNAMIFKPAELTPLTAARLAAIFSEAGLPDGVFNVVQGTRETGQLLTRAPRIRKVSLTGEVGTGRRVMADAAATLKYVTLELGGKSPLIVFDDADLDNAVSAALLGNFYSAGEVCSNATRVFVQAGIRDRFLARLKARVSAMTVGDPLDPKTDVGALISEDHMRKVLSYIAAGRKEGATLLAGGRRVQRGTLRHGAFVEPTVFANCHDDMTIVREEIFGPVMAVLDFTDEDEAVARANATPFGLAAGVFTRDLARAHRVIARLEAGTCWINQYNVTPIELPFGGYKQSGLGRENSRAALDHYTQIKSVYVALGDIEAPY